MIRVLICDDSATNRAAVRAALGGDPAIDVVGEAADGVEAVSLAAELGPDVVLMDVRMPGLDGVEATRRIRKMSPQMRVVAFTTHDEQKVVSAMIEAGASGYCLKGAPLAQIRRAVTGKGHIDERLAPKLLEELGRLSTHGRDAVERLGATNLQLEQRTEALTVLVRNVVHVLANTVEARDSYTGGHVDRVSRLALLLAERVDPAIPSDPQTEYGYLLHDIGKIGVPDAILHFDGPLRGADLEKMREHPELGARLLQPLAELERAREIVLHHHERWDGTGYPAGLGGEAIPLSARIFAICDTFDAMTTDRPYRKAVDVQTALREIESLAGSQFDPSVAREFLTLAERGLLREVIPALSQLQRLADDRIGESRS